MDDVTRDDAVRVVAEALHDRPGGCPALRCYTPKGHATARTYTDPADLIVTALVAAGWGDLAAERERLAVAVEDYARQWAQDDDDFARGAASAHHKAARLIRETPEGTP